MNGLRNLRKPLLAVVGALLISVGGSTVNAAPLQLDYYDLDASGENYWGGQDTNINPDSWGDVIGEKSVYEIYGIDAVRVGNSLVVDVYTNYAKAFAADTNTSGGGPTSTTRPGSLFIGTSPPDYNTFGSTGGSGGEQGFPHYDEDIYLNKSNLVESDLDRFKYVFDYTTNTTTVDPTDANPKKGLNSNQTGDAALYQINTPSSGVETSAGSGFRAFQPVDRIGGSGTSLTSTVGSWELGLSAKPNVDVNGDGNANSTDANIGRFTFTISDFFLLSDFQNGNGVLLAWAMSCANDIAMVFLQGSDFDIPIPASAFLLISALMGLGLVGRARKRAVSAVG